MNCQYNVDSGILEVWDETWLVIENIFPIFEELLSSKWLWLSW